MAKYLTRASEQGRKVQTRTYRRVSVPTRIKADSAAGKKWKETFKKVTFAATQANEISVYGEILPKALAMDGDFTSRMMQDSLAKVKGDFTLLVNSPGGEYGESIQTCAHVAKRQMAGEKATAYVMGGACSGASLLTLRADRVVMDPGAMIMVHRTWANFPPGSQLNSDDLRKEVSIMDRIDNYQASLLAKRMKISKEEALNMLPEETWFTAEEALKAGIAHAILDPTSGEEVQRAEEKVEEATAEVAAAAASATEPEDLADIEQAIEELDTVIQEIKDEPLQEEPVTTTSPQVSKTENFKTVDVDGLIEELEATESDPAVDEVAVDELIESLEEAEETVLAAEREEVDTREETSGENPVGTNPEELVR